MNHDDKILIERKIQTMNKNNPVLYEEHFSLTSLAPGERFYAYGLWWIALNVFDEGVTAITEKAMDKRVFDNEGNNWAESSLRSYLNSHFLNDISVGEFAKLDKHEVSSVLTNLVADNGEKLYGSCRDSVTILSDAGYRKYRDILPTFRVNLWSCTPVGCSTSRQVRVFTARNNFMADEPNCVHNFAPVVTFKIDKGGL